MDIWGVKQVGIEVVALCYTFRIQICIISVHPRVYWPFYDPGDYKPFKHRQAVFEEPTQLETILCTLNTGRPGN